MEKDPELVAPCGMLCAVCSRHFEVYGDEYCGRKRGQSKCAGCLPRGKECSFIMKRCSQLRNKELRFCYECDKFPCESLSKLSDKYEERYMNTSFIKNLECIRDHGMEAFLEQQNERFRCKKCSGTINIHSAKCTECGEPS